VYRMPQSPDNAGLSLPELLLVMGIAAVLLAIAAPALLGSVQANRVDAAAARLLNALQLARSEALARNTSVSLCPSDMSRAGEARCTGDYAGGWIVFANPGRDGLVQPESDVVLHVFDGLAPGMLVTNRAGTHRAASRVDYLADGTAHRNLTLQVCPPAGGGADSLSIVLNIVGRARLARGWGTCPEAA